MRATAARLLAPQRKSGILAVTLCGALMCLCANAEEQGVGGVLRRLHEERLAKEDCRLATTSWSIIRGLCVVRSDERVTSLEAACATFLFAPGPSDAIGFGNRFFDARLEIAYGVRVSAKSVLGRPPSEEELRRLVPLIDGKHAEVVGELRNAQRELADRDRTPRASKARALGKYLDGMAPGSIRKGIETFLRKRWMTATFETPGSLSFAGLMKAVDRGYPVLLPRRGNPHVAFGYVIDHGVEYALIASPSELPVIRKKGEELVSPSELESTIPEVQWFRRNVLSQPVPWDWTVEPANLLQPGVKAEPWVPCPCVIVHDIGVDVDAMKPFVEKALKEVSQ